MEFLREREFSECRVYPGVKKNHMMLRATAQCQSENQRKRGKRFPPASKLSLDFQGLTHASQAYGANFSPILRKFQLEKRSLLKAICEHAVDFLPNVCQSLDYSSPIPLRSDYRDEFYSPLLPFSQEPQPLNTWSVSYESELSIKATRN